MLYLNRYNFKKQKSAHPRRSEHKKLCTGNAQRVTVAHTVYVVDEITHQKASYLPINYSYYKGQCAKSKFYLNIISPPDLTRWASDILYLIALIKST